MRICAKGHRQICFEPLNMNGFIIDECPLCTAMGEIKAYEEMLNSAYQSACDIGVITSSSVDDTIKSIKLDGIQPS